LAHVEQTYTSESVHLSLFIISPKNSTTKFRKHFIVVLFTCLYGSYVFGCLCNGPTAYFTVMISFHGEYRQVKCGFSWGCFSINITEHVCRIA